MNKHLQEILKESNTIIIPGFGALTITSAKTGDIYFMPFLKHDDGRLAKYVAEKENIDVNEAKKNIVEYVNTLTKALDQGEEYEIIEFGKFIINKSNEIEFLKWEDYQQIDKSILAAAKRKKEEENKKNDEKVHHFIEDHKIESPNPLHLSLDEIQIHPVIEEITLSNNDEIVEKNKENDVKIENTLDNTLINNDVIQITDSFDNIVTQNENNSIVNIIEQDQENQNDSIENDVINNNTLTDSESNYNEKEDVSNINNDESLIEVTLPIKNKRKKKKKTTKVNKEEFITTENKKNKKRGGIIIWILVGLAITSGIIAYTLNQRKGEKIVIKEQIVVSKQDNKHKVEKHITTEIIKENNDIPNQNKKTSSKEHIISPEKLTRKEENIQTKLTNKKEVNSKKNTINKTTPTAVNKPLLTKKINVNIENKQNDVSTNTEVTKEKRNTSNKIDKTQVKTTNNIAVKTNTAIANKQIQPTDKVINQTIKNTNSKTNLKVENSNKPTIILTTNNKTNVSTKQIANTDKTKVDINAKNNNIQQTKNNATVNGSNPNGKKIQLIAGTFSDKTSAEKLMNQLKADGYTNTKISEKQGTFEVNIDSYATLSETYKALQKYKNGTK
ncbi:MAG: SPOR domain-containing protein [Crocinitomicaceae bacterium]|nr:SPOR domain-containing protein [Crocinitomicaceae bacterium]